MLKKIYEFLASLDLGFWLMGGVMLMLAVGSFVSGEASGINDTALLTWLLQAPIQVSWWLWATVALLALLALNTLLCSWETIRQRFRQVPLVRLLSPQFMHAGFLFIMLAHLYSAEGSMKEVMQIAPGSTIEFADGSRVIVDAINGRESAMGYLTEFSADFRHQGPAGEKTTTVSPNHPFFHGDFGVYLKDVQLFPFKAGLVEIHREPGAGWALAGSILFLVGNGVILWRRKA